MVMPIIDQHKPKCYLCHESFEDIEEMRKHQGEKHKEFFEFHEKNAKREPAPGDVSIF